MEKQLTSRNYTIILILISSLGIRSIIAFYLYPGFDEAYYYLYSKNLDWSYFDHPVLVALTTGFGVWLTGIVNQFTIRIGTLLLHTVSLYLLYLISKKLFNYSTAVLTLIIASIVPIFQIAFGVLTLPDVPLIFFWTLTLLCLVTEFFPQSPLDETISSQAGSDITLKSTAKFVPAYTPTYRLAIVGVLMGLTCLGKYHGFILGLGTIGFCFSVKKYRCALSSRWFWLGIGLFWLTLFPLWFWNLQHDWVSFRFQLSQRFEPDPTQPLPPPKNYNPVDVLMVFLGTIGYLFPTIGFPLWWISGKSVQNQFLALKSKTNIELDYKHKQLLILWISLPLTIGFTLLGGITQILPTWSMPGFWGLCLILGHYAQLWQRFSRKWVKRWLSGSAFLIYPLIFIILIHLNTGLLQYPNQYPFFNGLVSPQQDPSTELIDIRQLREGFASSPTLTKALVESSFIFTNVYYLGGYIAMAIAPLTEIPVTCFSHDQRGFAFWTFLEDLKGKDGLYVTIKRFAELETLNQQYQTYFTHIDEIGQIPIIRSGEVTEIFYVYQARNLSPLGVKDLLSFSPINHYLNYEYS
jgi:hypothetical protein